MRSALLVSPAWRARARGSVMAKRRTIRGRRRVKEDRAGVVVAVRTQRLAKQDVVPAVSVGAGHGVRGGRCGCADGVGIAGLGRPSPGGRGQGRTMARSAW
jgi:hypothetical protein